MPISSILGGDVIETERLYLTCFELTPQKTLLSSNLGKMKNLPWRALGSTVTWPDGLLKQHPVAKLAIATGHAIQILNDLHYSNL
jgi:hypothetical protein